MIRTFTKLSFLLFLFVLSACSDKSSEIERPNDPWVFRSVLDKQPRMVTIALHEDLWVAYNTQTAAIYKAWKGGVDFDGAVYNTVHGPQPTTFGDVWFENKHKNPWLILKGDKEITPHVKYKGHLFQDGHVILQYQLKYADGVISVFERPEFLEKENGQLALERNITTNNVPNGTKVLLKSNAGSVVSEDQVWTTGDYRVVSTTERTYKNTKGVDVDGVLTLASNGGISYTVNFLKRPLIEDPNKPEGKTETAEMPLGYTLIAKSDCKTCHNSFKETIGPAYIEVARKYQTNEANATMLVSKIKNGGSGVWGASKMTAHPDVPEEDLREMVNYILSMDAAEEAELNAITDYEVPAGKTALQGEEVDRDEMALGLFTEFAYAAGELTTLADKNWESFKAWQFFSTEINLVPEEYPWAVEDFAVQAQGYLYIPKVNNFVFRINSVDAAKLVIDGKTVIEMDGLSPMRTQDGEIILEEGYHPILIQHIKGGSKIGLNLEWKSFNDDAFKLVPASVFYHHKTKQQVNSSASGDVANKEVVPGDGVALTDVHPIFELFQARPDEFTPKVGGMDFLSDGRLVVSTWDPAGSVYILDNVESGDPSKITYKRIASGLAEPLGLKVVEDEIFVLQKQELTHLKDFDGDDVIDEYYALSQGWRVSANFHEFAFGLVYKEGFFYATLATAIEPGGASTNPQIPDRGKVVKIAKDGSSTTFMAHGLRTPNGIGLGVDDEIFVADNQGDWLPASKIVHIKQGAWYGSRSVDFEGTADLEEAKPVVWLPQNEIGNSPSQPAYIKEGVYAGQMIHGEVTHGGVKRVFVEKVGGEYQGAVFRFTQGLEAGVNRMAWSPNGDLYIGGVGSTGNWGHEGKLYYGLQRLEMKDTAAFEMLAIRAKSNGIAIEFTEPIEEGSGEAVSDYNIKQWWYEPTADYGGPKKDITDLTIKNIRFSEDRKTVHLELDGMKENHLVYIKIANRFLSTSKKELWSTEGWYTMNKIPVNQPL